MELTSTHGIILAAIGLAMFAILAVVWVLWRIRRFHAAQLDECPHCGKATYWMHDSQGGSWVRWYGYNSNIKMLVCETCGELVTPNPTGANPTLDPRPKECRAPYASEITGTGSRPVNPLEERVAACELDIAGLAQHIAPLDAIIRDVADTKARLDALESKRGGEGLRVFKAADWTWVWTGEELHVRFKPCQWTPSGYSLPAELYEQVAGVTELHGPERARIVREFLEWKGAQ